MTNLKISWIGDHISLKDFVSEELNMVEWSSPGGEKKLFTSDYVNISWWKNKKYLAIDGGNSSCILHILLRDLGKNYSIENSQFHRNEARSDSSGAPEPKKTLNEPSNEILTDIEGLKLDR